ncbi:MAG: DUF2726 domain-containing protein [Gammaproteobacteria bacterium]|nr:DUF2726 domain-containing protein [Gammaproteobacteria bacterium]
MSFTDFTNNGTVIVVVTIIIALALIEIFVINRRHIPKYSFALQRRSKILSPAEKNFFECLVNALGEEFHIFTKVAMLDVVQATPAAGYFERRRIQKRLQGECLDFVLCKKHDLSIFGIVELENFEKRDNQKEKLNREVLVSEVCKTTHLKLFYFDIRQDYADVDIRRLVTGRQAKRRAEPGQMSGSPSHLTVDNSQYEMYAKNRSCPQCNGEVVTKVAVKGKHIGQKYLLCKKYPYCDYRTQVTDQNMAKIQEKQSAEAAKSAGFKDWSSG